MMSPRQLYRIGSLGSSGNAIQGETAYGGGKLWTAASVASSGITRQAALSPIVVTRPSTDAGPSGPCGAEPPKNKPGPMGTKKYDDPAAGAAYDACQDKLARAAEAAMVARIKAGTAGGEGGCGPSPGGTYYDPQGVRDAWAACRARMLPPTALVKVEKPAPEVRAEIVRDIPRDAAPAAGSSSSYPRGDGGGGGGGGGGGSAEPFERAAPPLEQAPVSVTVDVPGELWIGGGILLAATLLGGIYLATRHRQPAPRKKAA